MSRHRTAKKLSAEDRIRLRLQLLIRSTVDLARDHHRHAMEQRKFGPVRWQAEIATALAVRDDAMCDARQLRWALTGEDTPSETRRAGQIRHALLQTLF